MGNCSSYCLTCCRKQCKDENVNEEISHGPPVSVITEQPSSSRNNTNNTNNNKNATDNSEISRKIRAKDSLRGEPSNISSNLKYPEETDPIETFRRKYKKQLLLDYGRFVPESNNNNKVVADNSKENIKAKELVKKDSSRHEPTKISSNLKYTILTESLRRKSSTISANSNYFKKKYGEITIVKGEFVKKHGLRRRSSNDSEKSNSSELGKEIINKIKTLRISKFTRPQTVTENSEILTQLLLEEGEFGNFTEPLINNPDKIYTLKQLDENSTEYTLISNFFTSTNKRCYTIQKIEEMFNPYLFLQYRLKYLEYIAKKKNVNEWMMFHGTKKSNLDNICRSNFNWRLNGLKFGSKNGKGVNFASNAYYSTHYGDTGFDKMMILAKVLIGKSRQGSATLLVPPGDVDTTTDHREPPQVYVKYDDNTFYPAYIIYYKGIDQNPKYPNGGLRGRGRGRGRIIRRRIVYNQNIV